LLKFDLDRRCDSESVWKIGLGSNKTICFESITHYLILSVSCLFLCSLGPLFCFFFDFIDIINNTLNTPQNRGYYSYGDTSVHLMFVQFLSALSTYPLEPGSVGYKMCIEIGESIIQNWKKYTTPPPNLHSYPIRLATFFSFFFDVELRIILLQSRTKRK
jgi:hypothetical protein